MKVFISWSGELSQKIGNALKEWIPDMLQAVQPYFTPEDIKKGERWSGEIAHELEEAAFGIFCLTRENLQSVWMHFEAGAISKNKEKSQVCPVLFNLLPTDITGPLKDFQATVFSRDEIYKLVRAMNIKLGEQSLSEYRLEKQFFRVWPQLEETVNSILSDQKKPIPNIPIRSEREILEEILYIVRDMEKQDRVEDVDASSCNHSLTYILIKLIDRYIVSLNNLKYDFISVQDVACDVYELKNYIVKIIPFLCISKSEKRHLYNKIKYISGTF